jgi:hypothetical protein
MERAAPVALRAGSSPRGMVVSVYALEGGSESVATVALVAGFVGVIVSPIFGLFLVWVIWTVDVHEVIAGGREVNRRWSEWAADKRGQG